jgi:hypothetical protein
VVRARRGEQGSTSTRTVQDAVLQCLALPATMPAALNASFAVVTTRGKWAGGGFERWGYWKRRLMVAGVTVCRQSGHR